MTGQETEHPPYSGCLKVSDEGVTHIPNTLGEDWWGETIEVFLDRSVYDGM
jgi:hypothetical protein